MEDIVRVKRPPLVATLALGAALALIMLVSILYWDVKHTLNEIEKNGFESTMSLREGLFNDMVDRVTEKAETDRERAIAVARYICAHVRNDGPNPDNDSSHDPVNITDTLTAWEYRQGVCGWRSRIMIRALTRLNIKAEIFNIYDYDFGHSCVLAHYDGGDHFFDPTYGGYFTGDDGHVLSWNEIMADPVKAVEGMKVFPKTLDTYGQGDRAANAQRMRDVYVPALIAGVRNAGVRNSRVFVLPVTLDLGLTEGPLVLGKANASETDMREIDVMDKTRCWYLNVLGRSNESFAYAFKLAGVKGAKPVTLDLRFCRQGFGDAQFLADSSTGRIISGEKGPYCRSARDWRIVYQPVENAENVITVRLSSYEKRSGAFLDNLVVF